MDPLAAKDRRIFEVHPEVCLAAMNDGPLSASKMTWSGLRQRMDLLEANGIVVPSDIGAAGGLVAADDVLDAAAAAWSARRRANGVAQSLPSDAVAGEPAIWH